MKNVPEIKRSNAMNEARYKLSMQEQRLILTIASMIKDEDTHATEYSMTAKELSKLWGISLEQTYKEADAITEELHKRTLVIRDTKAKYFRKSNWIHRSEYKNGVLTMRMHEDLAPHLFQLKKAFTVLQLETVLKLKSVYAIRIYELLKQYEKFEERTFSVQELREILILEDKYPQYYDFKKKVILQAQKELANTDMAFEFTEDKKDTRSIQEITFTFAKKTDDEKELTEFKKWFHKEFKDYEGALVGTLYDGEIYLNKKGYFYDARDKKHKFTKDEIDRIWLGLMDKRYVLEETIRVRTKRNTNLATPQKAPVQKQLEAEIIEENPNQGILTFDAEIDCSPQLDLSDLTAKEIEEIAFEDNATFSSQEEMEEDIAFEKEAIKQGFLARIGGFLTVVKEGFPTMPNEKGK